MSDVIKVDPEAFGRGVDEVLTLKPIRRAIGSLTVSIAPRSNIFGHRSTAKVRDVIVSENSKKDGKFTRERGR